MQEASWIWLTVPSTTGDLRSSLYGSFIDAVSASLLTPLKVQILHLKFPKGLFTCLKTREHAGLSHEQLEIPDESLLQRVNQSVFKPSTSTSEGTDVAP